MKKNYTTMSEENIIKTLGGKAVGANALGATLELWESKKSKAEESVAEQLDERDQKTGEHGQYTYKQKAKAALVGATEEQDVAFVAEHDPEGNYSDEHKEVMRDLADEAESLEKYTTEITKIDADYAEIEDKDSDKAKKNRDEYNNAVEHKRKDDTAKKESEDAEAEKMKSVKAEIDTLTGILSDVDEEVAEYDSHIAGIEEREKSISQANAAYQAKYEDHDDYVQDVKDSIEKEEGACILPQASDAHKQSTKHYWGARICSDLKECIEAGKYSCKFPYLYETEIYELTRLGYHVYRVKDKNRRDKRSDKDDRFDYVVRWDKLIGGAK